MSYQGIFDLTGKTAVVTGARKELALQWLQYLQSLAQI